MAIDFDDLFTVWGHDLGALNQLNTFRGTTLPAAFDTLAADFASAEQDLANGMWTVLSSGQSANNGLATSYQTFMTQALSRYVTNDVPLISTTSLSLMTELYNQMVASSQSIDRPTVGLTATAGGSNVGDTVIVSAAKLADGRQADLTMAETVNILCTNDSYIGGGTAYNEPFSFNGAAAISDQLSYLWPGGSGASGSVNVVNAAVDGIVREGDFEGTWTPANTPPSPWTVQVGTVSSTVLQGGTFLRGSKSLQIVGNGSQLTALRQELTTLKPNTSYAFNLWYKLGTSSPAAGAMAFRLVTQGGTTINDQAGTANTTSVTLSGVADTNWHNLGAIFRLPNTMPSQVFLEIALTTALTNAVNLFIDLVGASAAQVLYAMGPCFALFSGGTPATKGDSFSIVTTNNEGVASFVRGLDRAFGMKALGIQLPSVTSGETQADSKVTI